MSNFKKPKKTDNGMIKLEAVMNVSPDEKKLDIKSVQSNVNIDKIVYMYPSANEKYPGDKYTVLHLATGLNLMVKASFQDLEDIL